MGLEGHRSCSVLHKSLPLGLGRLWSGLELSVLCRGQEWPGTDPPFLQAGCELLLPPSTLCTPVLPGGMINWNRLFPPLRQRRNINYQDGPRSEPRASPPLEVSEEQEQECPVWTIEQAPDVLLTRVARLMEMGFSRGDALEALRASNNDLNVATNFLLQH
ncbi:hypothetical protein ACRRTK_019238 [Alexandromys fortis]